jgi:peptide subunit release factor 1 (eRF1)
MYWDDERMQVEPYERKQKHYFCGKELLKFHAEKDVVYRILVLDMRDCCFADVYSDGEIDVRWKHHSEVPHKHRAGGQSAARFSRIRDNEITLWFKRIDQYLKEIDGEFYLGMSKIYYPRFFKTLSTHNQEKIRERMSCGYSGLSGIYQMVNILNEKSTPKDRTLQE